MCIYGKKINSKYVIAHEYSIFYAFKIFSTLDAQTINNPSNGIKYYKCKEVCKYRKNPKEKTFFNKFILFVYFEFAYVAFGSKMAI